MLLLSKSPTACLALVLLVAVVTCREYHYDKPQVPFPLPGVQQIYTPPQQVQQVPPMTTVVRTFEPNARDYRVFVQQSPRIYEGRQVPATVVAARPTAQYLPPAQQYHHQQYQHSNGVATIATTSTTAGATGTSYAHPAQGSHQPGYLANAQAQYAAGGQYAPNSQYSPNVNPLVAGPYGSQVHSHVGGSHQAQQGAAYGAYAATGQYASGQVAGVVNFGPNGQRQGFAISGGGGGVSGAPGAPGQFGDYVSQSEVGQLNVYPHTQQNGNTRPYTRLITTCYPNGQCERATLGPGQADPRHQHIVASARGRVQPVSDKCQRIAAAKAAAAAGGVVGAGASANVIHGTVVQPGGINGPTIDRSSTSPVGDNLIGLPIRPPNRRLFAYSEVVGQQYSHN